ncbi:MAG: hypothetical protein EXQ96_03955 [Alphaproteobacteria bacterium]|nr:hypothetical protein [Alphaproteobacteria bacterium]
MTGATFTEAALAPLLPWPWLLALAVLAVAVIALALLRRAPGAGWRAAVAALGLLVLLNPSLVSEEREPLKDVAVVVVDESASQGIGERRVQTAEALAAVERRLAAFADLETRFVRAGREGANDLRAGSAGTRLFGAIGRALADVPAERVAGAILITDGQVHDVPGDPKSGSLHGPLHVLLTGQKGEQDRRLVIEQAPSYGIVGQSLVLGLRVDDSVGVQQRTAQLRLKRAGTELQRTTVTVGETTSIEFSLDHAGPTVLEIETDSLPGELATQNNRAVVVVNGVRERLRVLLVSGEAHVGERTWRNLLKSDPAVDLVHFTILRPPDKQDGTPIRELALIAFPIRELFEIKLKEFDLIIFDRYRRRGVIPTSYLENIARYVAEGGALLEAAGPAFASPMSLYRTPLQDVLPGAPTGQVFDNQGFVARLTDTGLRHAVTGDLPGAGSAGGAPSWGRWFRQIDVDPNRGVVLMSGIAERPILMLDRIGKGRVAQLLSDHIWLWARGFEGGGPQLELLRRVAHWLMKEPDLEEEDLRALAAGNALTITRRSLGREAASVTVTAPSGTEQRLPLVEGQGGRWTATIPAEEIGLYRVADGTRTALAAVGALNPLEFADLRATEDNLATLVAATAGGIRWLADQGVPEIRRTRPGRSAEGRGWIGLRANHSYLVTGIRQVPLLPVLLVLSGLLALVVLAWRREAR